MSLVQNTQIVGVIYNREPNSEGYLYTKRRQFREFLPELAEAFAKRGMKLIVLCGDDSYIGAGQFLNYWVPNEHPKGTYRKVDGAIRPDIIYDKSHFKLNDGALKQVNGHQFGNLGRNKYTQYEMFKDLQPQSVLLSPGRTNAQSLESLKTSKIVIKPLNMNGGKGIQVVERSAAEQLAFDQPMLAQEFIETSAGIPGLAEGRHDLRLYVLNGTPKLASIRTPQEDSYIANTSAGGSIKIFEASKVPSAALDLAAEVDERIRYYGPTFYSVDMMYDGSKWWVIEINDRPGIPALYQGDYVAQFHEDFVNFIEGALAS